MEAMGISMTISCWLCYSTASTRKCRAGDDAGRCSRSANASTALRSAAVRRMARMFLRFVVWSGRVNVYRLNNVQLLVLRCTQHIKTGSGDLWKISVWGCVSSFSRRQSNMAECASHPFPMFANFEDLFHNFLVNVGSKDRGTETAQYSDTDRQQTKAGLVPESADAICHEPMNGLDELCWIFSQAD